MESVKNCLKNLKPGAVRLRLFSTLSTLNGELSSTSRLVKYIDNIVKEIGANAILLTSNIIPIPPALQFKSGHKRLPCF